MQTEKNICTTTKRKVTKIIRKIALYTLFLIKKAQHTTFFGKICVSLHSNSAVPNLQHFAYETRYT